MPRTPKDYELARAAFNNYKPEVSFDDLNREAQMRWVAVTRTVLKGSKRSEPQIPSPVGAGVVPAVLKLRDKIRELEQLNDLDEERITTKPMGECSPEEKRVRWRVAARTNRLKDLQRKLGKAA